MARPSVVVVLDVDVSWPPFRLERVVLFSVQSCILQQLVTVAKHLQRPTRLRLVRQPLQRLAQLHSIRLVQPLLIRSSLGAVRQRGVEDGRAFLTWPVQYQPTDSFRVHFEFGLKYERTG